MTSRKLPLLVLLLLSVGCSSYSKKGVDRGLSSTMDSFRDQSVDRSLKLELDGKLQKLQGYDRIALECAQGNFNGAIEALRNLAQSERKNPNYWNTAGLCQFRKGDFAQAQGSFQMGITLAQNKAWPATVKAAILNNLGLMAYQFNRVSEAKSFFEEGIKIDADNSLLHFNFASVAYSLGYIDIAKSSILKLSKLNRGTLNDPDVLLLQAQIAVSQGDHQLSLKLLSSLPNEISSREDIGSLLSLNYLIIGKKERAKETLSKITQVSDKRNHALIDHLKRTLEILEEAENNSDKERS
jgi:tetratricopeptide (TPR) repeat protein